MDSGTSGEDRVTFTRFFQDHGKNLVRLAYLLTGDSADAEDVAQEVLEERREERQTAAHVAPRCR